MNKNTGYIEVKPANKDYMAGGESVIVYKDLGVKWSDYLPLTENQYQPKQKGSLYSIFDTQSCVSFSYLNSIEMQGNRLIAKNLLSVEAYKWLKDNGYIINGNQFNFSDRALAKMSETTEDGNSLPKVAETARKLGLLPESDWAFRETIFSWDEYMEEIPDELLSKAKKFLEYFELPYEWVWTGGSDADRKDVFQYHLKNAPIQIASRVCPQWSRFTLKPGDIINGCPVNGTGHATVIFDLKDSYFDFDHYQPYVKNLALDYPIGYGMKVIIQEKKPVEIPTIKHIFLFDMEFGQRNTEVKFLQEYLIKKGFLKTGLNTGYYGENTRLAVLSFQKSNNITTILENTVTIKGRHVGPKTRAFINNNL